MSKRLKTAVLAANIMMPTRRLTRHCRGAAPHDSIHHRLARGTGRTRGGEDISSSSLRLGRVDVFFATEFHGGPFQEEEGSNGGDSNNRNQDIHDMVRGGNGGVYPTAASASQSVCCDATVSTAISSGPAERRGAGGGVDNGCVVKDTEPPWFSRRVMTAG